MNHLMAFVGAIFSALYLLFDTIMIVNGNARACYNLQYLDQAILATEALYLDVIAIFIYVL